MFLKLNIFDSSNELILLAFLLLSIGLVFLRHKLRQRHQHAVTDLKHYLERVEE